MNDLALIDEQLCSLTPTAATFKEGLTFDEWKKIGAAISKASRSIQWWIGDWLSYGAKSFADAAGPTQLEWADQFGFQSEALRGCLIVSERVQARFPTLTWQHHREVAAMPPKEQRAWLKQAEAEKWTVSELRLAIRGDGAEVVDNEPVTGGPFNPLRVALDLKRWALTQDVSTWEKERREALKHDLEPVVELWKRL